MTRVSFLIWPFYIHVSCNVKKWLSLNTISLNIFDRVPVTSTINIIVSQLNPVLIYCTGNTFIFAPVGSYGYLRRFCTSPVFNKGKLISLLGHLKVIVSFKNKKKGLYTMSEKDVVSRRNLLFAYACCVLKLHNYCQKLFITNFSF